MASSPSEQPHIVSLVLQSKKALQQGEALCSRAHSLSNASAQSAFDLLAVESKVKWMTEAVLEQLKVRTAFLRRDVS
jgi:autophagy-related protein 17